MELPFDPQTAVALLRREDRRLARVIDQVGPFTLQPQALQSPFQALLRAIVYQQLSGRAAATIYARLKEQFPGRHGLRPAALVGVSDETLRAVGLSRAKVAAVKDLAAKTLDGTVPPLVAMKRMDDFEILERLVSVRGIGPWTVEMLLIFRLGRPDVLPTSDLGVRRGFMLTYRHDELPKPTELVRHGERWRPYRSVASWYMWRAVDLHRRAAAAQVGQKTEVTPFD